MDLVSQNVYVLAWCADGWTCSYHNGLCYKYQSTKLPWTEARAHCQGLSAGGDLASVPDQATNDFLTTLTTGASKSSIRRFVITQKAPTRAFS